MDLQTRYMGLELKHPLVASASPLSESVDNIRRMEDAGAAAVVMFSLFEEQLQHEAAATDYFLNQGGDCFAEALSYFPDLSEQRPGPEAYLNILRRASESTDIPIIASLNGVTHEGWTDIARQMQQAGAAAIELNVYSIPTDLSLSGASIEQKLVDIVRAVKATVDIPVALKMSPFFSAIGNMAKQLDEAGVDGLVLFNRFYQPDFDLDRLTVQSNLKLSGPEDMRLPLLWIAILHGKLKASLAASRGVEGADEILKYLLAGADVVMTTSALLRHGIEHLATLLEDLNEQMSRHAWESLDEVRGRLSQQRICNPTAFERANYIRELQSYQLQP